MQDLPSDFETNLEDLEGDEWFDALDEFAEKYGTFEPLGNDHVAAFLDAGKKLVVTFESFTEIEAHSERNEPRGFDFVRAFGWSQLSIISRNDSWFREKSIYGYIDRLIDDGFFEDFDEVLFYGAHRGGYAAAAYSVAAPGARVMAIRPVATLDPDIASWDRRYLADRRINFTDRFGYAPDMIEAADHCYVLFDPREDADAMHAALFTRRNTTKFRLRGLGDRIDVSLDDMKALNQMVGHAMAGTLTPDVFAEIYRARRYYIPYLRSLVMLLESRGEIERASHVCRQVLRERQRPFFARKLAAFDEMLSVDEPAE